MIPLRNIGRRPGRGSAATKRMATVGLAAVLMIGGVVAASGPALASEPGYIIISAESATNSVSPKSVTAACPAGQQVLSPGIQIRGALGHVLVDDIQPNAALTSVTVKAYEDGAGTSEAWSVRGFAVCVNARIGLERVARTSSTTSVGTGLDFPCPEAKVVVGVGAAINNGFGRVSLVAMSAESANGPNRVSVAARETQDGTTDMWSLTAYAICDFQHASQHLNYDETITDSTQLKTSTAGCGTSYVVIGSGFQILNGGAPTAQVLVHSIRPRYPRFATVEATEGRNGYSGSWQLRSNAICARP
jgi:hypothetical protein